MRHRKQRASKDSRLRVAAIIFTLAVMAVLAVLVACPPPARKLAGPSISASPPTASENPPGPPPKPDRARSVSVESGGTETAPLPEQVEPRGMLAVILDDAGYSLQELQPFLALPGPLTVAVLPNLPHSAEAARRVLSAGKDLILHCPMEANGGEDPGPGAIRVGMSEAEIDRTLAADFASVPGARGMNNHMGSRATADPALMEAVLGYLKRQGLFLVDSRTTALTVAPAIASRLGVPFLQRNLFIDDERDEKAVADAFNVGIRQARVLGTAVVIGHVQNKVVLDILRTGQKELVQSGVRLARLEEIMTENRVSQNDKVRAGARFF